jgi:hypothetical protein
MIRAPANTHPDMITPRARFSISPRQGRGATSCERRATDQRGNAFAEHFRRGPDGEVNDTRYQLMPLKAPFEVVTS